MDSQLVGDTRYAACSLPGALRSDACRAPDRIIFTSLNSRGEQTATLTVAQLDTAARSLGAALREIAKPGERVLVPAMSRLRFHVAFLACLYARLVAIPVPSLPAAYRIAPDRPDRTASICRDAEPAAAIVPDDALPDLAAAWRGDPVFGRVGLVSVERRSAVKDLLDPEPVSRNDIAFLQYTSGSTTAPRGVMVTHGGILANQAMLFERMGVTESTVFVSWLPLYHDMGLCLGLLQPVHASVSAVLLEPTTFVARPDVWLRTLSEYPDAMSAAPNFAYTWCARRVRDNVKASLDLRGWRVAINGAETVRAHTIKAFREAFGSCGFRDEAMTPAYGLAESTLFVSGNSGEEAPVIRRYDRLALGKGRAEPVSAAATEHVELVGCGRAAPGVDIAVVDPESRQACPERTVGEIWVHSPSNGVGYWGGSGGSSDTFGAVRADGAAPETRWLRTGDLGFLDDGELFITGRRKDVIVIHGVNYFPDDFEHLAQLSHPLLGSGTTAAFAVEGETRVSVVVEVSRETLPAEATKAAAAAVRSITARLPVTTDVVVVPRGQMPRTSSGKIRRRECADRLRDGQLKVLARWPRQAG